MNNIDMLTSQVEQHSTNPIVASMLVDALMEERDMQRSEAEAHVMRVQEVALDAAFIRRAAELLATGSPRQRWLRARIWAAVDAPPWARPAFLIIPGLASPAITHHGGSFPVTYWGRSLITVGGQWVIRIWREHLADVAERREQRDRVRKR